MAIKGKDVLKSLQDAEGSFLRTRKIITDYIDTRSENAKIIPMNPGHKKALLYEISELNSTAKKLKKLCKRLFD